MTKIAVMPTAPMGAKFDPNETLLANAASYWEHEKTRIRTQREHNARVLARRVFHTDDLSFKYDDRIGLDVPTFEIEDELIAWNGDEFSLIEFCSDCGQTPMGRAFRSLSALGRVIEESNAADDFVCQSCKLLAAARQK